MAVMAVEEAARSLSPRDRATDPLSDSSWTAARVGRNDVWRLAHRSDAQETFFAKFYTSPAGFQRELSGLRRAWKLALEHDWLMAAEVVIADEEEGFILTRALPGTPLRHLIRKALRRAQPGQLRREALEHTRWALARVIAWIGLWQRASAEEVVNPQDDRPMVVAERIAAKLARLQAGGTRTHSRLASSVSDHAGEIGGLSVLTHGDLSFGNILCDTGRVGIVDFENTGLGLPCRDFAWIRYNLEQGNYRWYYRKSGPLLALVETTPADALAVELYRLEFVIDHLLILQMRSSGPGRWRETLTGAAERRWVGQEFRRLRSVFGAP